MQLSGARNPAIPQKKQAEQNKLEPVKKKSSLLKKRKLPPTKLFANIDLKHVINIEDVCFVNEDSLRFPDTSQETLLKALYSYKAISKVTLNNSYINVQLKKNNENLLPAQYFIQRLKSFGDQQMANIANHLEKINRQFSILKGSCPIEQKQFVKDKQETLLLNFLEKMEGKNYLIYFNEITPQRSNLKSVIFSVPLLQALGCNMKNIAMDFLKYKHVFFEVFTAKKYKFFINKCMENFSKIQSELMIRPDMSEEQKQEITSFIYDDEVIRTKQGAQGVYEEISNARVKWFCPHPSICCFQILQLDEAQSLKGPKLRKINNFEETKPQEELKELKNIGISFPLLSIQDDSTNNQQMALEHENSNNKNHVNGFSGNYFIHRS